MIKMSNDVAFGHIRKLHHFTGLITEIMGITFFKSITLILTNQILDHLHQVKFQKSKTIQTALNLRLLEHMFLPILCGLVRVRLQACDSSQTTGLKQYYTTHSVQLYIRQLK
jgi:hypothetical protein